MNPTEYSFDAEPDWTLKHDHKYWVSSKQHYLIEIDAKKVFFRISKCTFWFFITCHIARHTMITRGDYIIYEYRPYYVCLCTCCTFIYTLIRFSSICLSNVLFWCTVQRYCLKCAQWTFLTFHIKYTVLFST